MPENEENNQHPTWLKSIQNGGIGEARAKAFLLDRFWVLERSVDIEGADFIIQRRLTGKNLLDRQAPRLGVIQVKFFGTNKTGHFVHREYAIAEDDNPREEFFVLCFMGNEENPSSYLISAKDLIDDFPLITKKSNEGFAISYNHITSNGKYKIISNKVALDRIEKKLEFAEFTKNRSFLSWALPSSKNELSAILPEYAEPIGNCWGNIPSGFEDIKRSARRGMFDVEEVLELLHKLTEETDPRKAEGIVDKISYYCKSGTGRGWSISIPDDLYDEDFFYACKKHKEIYDSLQKDGLLNSFFKMKEDLKYYIVNDIEQNISIAKKCVHLFSFTYDPDTFSILTFNARFIGKDEYKTTYGSDDSDGFEKVLNFSEGTIEYSWLPGAQRSLHEDVNKNIEWYKEQDFYFYYQCLNLVFSLKYYDEFDL